MYHENLEELLYLWVMYEDIKNSGQYDMVAECRQVADLMDVDLGTYLRVLNNYQKLKDLYKNKFERLVRLCPRYESIKNSGMYDMVADCDVVAARMGVDLDTYFEIVNNYTTLYKIHYYYFTF